MASIWSFWLDIDYAIIFILYWNTLNPSIIQSFQPLLWLAINRFYQLNCLNISSFSWSWLEFDFDFKIKKNIFWQEYYLYTSNSTTPIVHILFFVCCCNTIYLEGCVLFRKMGKNMAGVDSSIATSTAKCNSLKLQNHCYL